MRFVSILLSIFTLGYLGYLFVNEEKSDRIEAYIDNSPKLVIPAYISDTPLEVEKVWQQLKADRIKAKQPVQDTTEQALKNANILTLGDNKYALYGIFNANEGFSKGGAKKYNIDHSMPLSDQAFILIKALGQKNKIAEASMLKIMQGQELSEGIVLVAVSSNSINFKQGDEFIRIKLFEPKKNSYLK